MAIMQSKWLTRFYWILFALGVLVTLGHIVRILMGAESFRLLSFWGPAAMCGISYYQLHLDRRRRRGVGSRSGCASAWTE
jgi:hypothetical protein